MSETIEAQGVPELFQQVDDALTQAAASLGENALRPFGADLAQSVDASFEANVVLTPGNESGLTED